MFIADSRDANIDLIYYALNGSIANNNGSDVLLMNNGEIQRRDVKTGNVSIIKFDQYAFDLSQFTDTGGDMVLYAKDRHLSYLINPDVNDPIYQTKPQLYRAELHKRLTSWIYPLVFAMIALVLAGDARSHREARISASFSAISLSLVVYWAGYFVSDRAEKDVSFIPVMYLIPFGVIAICLYALLSGRSLSLPASWTDKIQDATEQLTIRVRGIYERIAERKKTSGGQS